MSKYEQLVNFKTNLDFPRHNWFEIKEGYSALLVSELIEELNIKKDDGIIFDPFSGSGTTVLQSSLMGYKSIGVEVNPFLYFISKIKTTKFSNNFYNFFKKFNFNYPNNFDEIPKLSISKKLFGEQLNDVLMVKKYISEIKDEEIRNFLKLSFLCSLSSCATAKKDGNGLKYPKNKTPKRFKEEFRNNTLQFLNDSKISKILNKPLIYCDDSVDLVSDKKFKKKYSGKFSLVVFSPPYANCFDYTEVYKMELWFGDFIKSYPELKILRNQSLSSHLNKTIDRKHFKFIKPYTSKLEKMDLWSNKIIPMLENYFYEMYTLINNIKDLLSDGSTCVIVVGNSAYGNIAIPTDKIFCEIAKDCGYKDAYFKEARKLGTSSQQYKKINNPKLLRESLVYLKK
jgi:DNA modification methylase